MSLKLLLKKRGCFSMVLLSFLLMMAGSNAIALDNKPTSIQGSTTQNTPLNPLFALPAEQEASQQRLKAAIDNPEYMLNHWIELPTFSKTRAHKKILHLSLREAILLALRYNPNIQNAELERIIQRYALRLAHNAFELQYALQGSAAIERSHFDGIGSATNKSFLATPDLGLKTKMGTDISLNLRNNVSNYDQFSPVLDLSVSQPLLQGFGKAANEAPLLNAIDNEMMNKINLKQAVCDQITQVITAYRTLILSGNNIKNQRLQLTEAQKNFTINQQKIAAGQLEPTANTQQSYQIESLNLLVEQALNDFNIAAQNLLQSIGLDPDLHLAVPNDISIHSTPIPDLKQAIQQGLQHNASFLAQKMVLRADERAYQVAKNHQLWKLDLTGNILAGATTDVEGKSGVSGIYNGHNITEGANITLTVPIRDLNQRSEIINAKVKLEKDRLNLLALKRSLITTISNLIHNIESLAKRYTLAEKQVILAEKSYTLEKKKQQAGISSALDVSNTQNQLIQAQSGLINAKIAYLNQVSELQRLLGTTLQHWQIQMRFGS